MARRSAPPPPAPMPRSAGVWSRAQRWLRVFVVSLGLLGLTPIAEAFEQRLGAPAAASTVTEACTDDCEDGCTRSGCHGDQHHCGCCAPMARLAARSPWRLESWPTAAEPHPRMDMRGPLDRALPPPWQPPRT